MNAMPCSLPLSNACRRGQTNCCRAQIQRVGDILQSGDARDTGRAATLKGECDSVYGSEHPLYCHLSLIFYLSTDKKRVRLESPPRGAHAEHSHVDKAEPILHQEFRHALNQALSF